MNFCLRATTQYKQYIASMVIPILYCHNMSTGILYWYNIGECILYRMYCSILFYCHIISNTESIQIKSNQIRPRFDLIYLFARLAATMCFVSMEARLTRMDSRILEDSVSKVDSWSIAVSWGIEGDKEADILTARQIQSPGVPSQAAKSRCTGPRTAVLSSNPAGNSSHIYHCRRQQCSPLLPWYRRNPRRGENASRAVRTGGCHACSGLRRWL